LAAVLLALGSSVCWGSADFLGGVSSRRIPVAAVLFASQLPALVLAATWALAAGDAPPAWRLAVAFAAGCAGVIALGAFYRGLAIGTMSIVAPISSTGAAVPVAIGLATGERPGALSLAGMLAAVAGVVLASREEHPDAEQAAAGRLSILLAVLAALGFGTFYVAIHAAAEESAVWALLPNRAASVGALALVAAAARVPVSPARLEWPALAAVGVLDVSANGLFAVASTRGLLSVTAVLGSLYPLATLLLARLLLGERIRRIQELGVLAALTGVALIAAG
jgi:drug/metabolite transporter (DMT)-like permease